MSAVSTSSPLGRLEGTRLMVLRNYVTVNSYYRLVKTVEGDPEFDARRAQTKLRRYVESHDHAIATKANIVVDHFMNQVYRRRMVGGEARAMVVTSSIRRALDYYTAIKRELEASGSGVKAIVAWVCATHQSSGTGGTS